MEPYMRKWSGSKMFDPLSKQFSAMPGLVSLIKFLSLRFQGWLGWGNSITSHVYVAHLVVPSVYANTEQGR